jgi:uncharacterized coiled-coil protein SlyX
MTKKQTMKTETEKMNMKSQKLILSLITITCLALVLLGAAVAPKAFGVVPPPDGGYPGFNTAEGQNALFSLTTGTANAAVGWFSLWSNAEGSFNTATGAGTLLFNTANENTAFGAAALLFNTTGEGNTATGVAALLNNTTGTGNTANGYQALVSNTTGGFNTAVGLTALFSNTTGGGNTANGESALYNNTTGNNNTATGDAALFSNTEGTDNTATGIGALYNNTTGTGSTAIGSSALVNNTTGIHNTALGVGAGSSVTTASNVIAIGHPGANVDNSSYIGNIYSNIQPVLGTDPDYVTIGSDGRLGRSNLNGSSRRFKHDIKPIDNASEVIFGLKPVSFRYNKEYDAMQRPSFGLIAEEVAEVAPDLVGRNKKGEPESVRYEQINAMLLNEFLKENKRVQAQQETISELKSTVAQQQKGMEVLTAQLKEQAAALRKVSDQLETNRHAPQLVVNP